MTSQVTTKKFLPLLAAGLFLMTVASAAAQSTEDILKAKPSQPDVTIDTPSGDDIAKCKVVPFEEPGYAGKLLYGPDGTTPLRVICRQSSSKGNKVEEVRFYKNGVEVFRDNYVAGECRWMGDAGSRWGVRNRSGIASWKAITPEEATAEAVKALTSGDLDRYKAVALSEKDIQNLGITGPARASTA